MARPELARPVDGVREVLGELAERYRLVAILTGRRADEVTALLDVPNVEVLGLYGSEDSAPDLVAWVAPLAAAAAADVPEAWIEDKGSSVAVHYRQTPDPAEARATLMTALRSLAAESGLELVEGKMVLELIPPGRPLKGDAVQRLAHQYALEAVLYAGDDHADLDAFDALDRLRERGIETVAVAVRGDDAPASLVERATLLADGPRGLVELLRSLVV